MKVPARASTPLACVALLILALMVRGGFVAGYGMEVVQGGDAPHYMALASHIAAGDGFTDDGVTPSTYRPPLFSWLLGTWCRIAGSTSLRTMVVFQILVQSLCAPLAYLLALKVQPHRAFAAAAGLALL